MEMALKGINKTNLNYLLKTFSIPLGILILVAMMVIPLNPLLLDLFFTSNLLVSLLVLMVALQAFKPLDFSSFPTVLLFSTVLRLGLNVASTRIILSDGHTGTDAAGNIIEAFGAFVMSGSYVVGLFVFSILVIINLIVITKGAGRVSEVAARFTLDAMPGKQMAIDADLNAGIMTSDEAKAKRLDLSKEGEFYGSMDGAAKFVKGDAIAGILILVINIIGGLIIGTVQHDLTLNESAEKYILLTVGDGLVAQIPSLLLALATATIVTRIASDKEDLSGQISNQMGMAKAWIPVSAVLFVFGLVPGMPNKLFLVAGLISGLLAWRLSKNNSEVKEETEDEKNKAEDDPGKIDIDDVSDNAAISLDLGYGLISLVDSDLSADLPGNEDKKIGDGPLISKITGIRKQVSKELGFVLPHVRVKDDLALDANTYVIKIGHTIVAQDKIFTDRKLAMPSDETQIKIQGIETKDPSFGMTAYWIEKHLISKAESNGYMVIDPEAVIGTHLNQILVKYAGELISQDDVQILLDNLTRTNPQLVQSVVPKLIPLHHLTIILRNLLVERVPINDLKKILEALSNLSEKKMNPDELSEAVRPAITSLLIQRISGINEPLNVSTFNAEFEQMLIAMAQKSSSEGLLIDPSLAKQIIQSIMDINEKMSAENKASVIVTSPLIRKDLSILLRQHIEDIVVLAFTELPETKKIKVIATIGEKILTQTKEKENDNATI
ncbi:flagellar biosynthesis protein FlhA [Rickettsiales bacterium]|nr:flagellar biosynthesis protein FlhA [Rickettsiales bacterium]